MELTIENPPLRVNIAALDVALRTALAATYGGLSGGGQSGLRLHLDDNATEGQQANARAIVAAHDATALTPEQAALQTTTATIASAAARIASIPAWATISEADALAWLDANLNAPITAGRTALTNATTLAQMKVIVSGMLDMTEKQNDVLTKLTRMALALRDTQWPGLTSGH